MVRDEPDFFVIHDWWLALTASAFGKIGAVKEPTVLYRQHSGNDMGAKRVLSPGYIYYVLTHLDKMAAIIDSSYKQSASFYKACEDILSEKQMNLLIDYASIPKLSRLRRIQTVLKNKTLLHGFARQTAQFALLLKERRVVT